MNPKYIVGQEVWLVINGFVVNTYVQEIRISAKLVSYSLFPEHAGFSLMAESELCSDRPSADSTLTAENAAQAKVSI